MNSPITEARLAASSGNHPVPEDQARADFYALISHLLLTPPDAALLNDLACAASLDSEDANNPLDRAWEKLVAAAGITHADAVREEFNELFVSTGTPLINPYASLYLAGFMNEKPLARLRADLQTLGLARGSGVCELEDHLSGLCDAMRVMISGAQGGTAQTLDKQRDFFTAYIAPWYSRCLSDIRTASGARFYSLVADFAHAFFDIEAQAFEMNDAAHTEDVQD
jgi:TorA maturation chaperone TorD